MIAILLVFIVAVFSSAPCFGEPITAIRLNGPDDNRLNIVVLGDGYTSSQLTKFATDTDSLVNAIFQQEPYKEYANYFNVFRIDVTSNESGVDHPERGVAKDTALGANYNCRGIQRLICIDVTAVTAVLSRSVPPANVDLVMVLVNDAEYGGSGGRNAVASTHTLSVELMLHEAGHTFGLLADEYEQDGSCNTTVEPAAANATKETGRDLVKWRSWIAATTTLPTTTRTAGIPGLYLGSAYCAQGLYRPTYDSKMRTLQRPFEQINTEQLVRRFYSFVSPIEGVSPASGNVTADRGQPLAFSITRPRPATHDISVTWTLDGQPIGSNDAVSLDSNALAAGGHVLEVVARDRTVFVRSDPTSALAERFQWTLEVRP